MSLETIARIAQFAPAPQDGAVPVEVILGSELEAWLGANETAAPFVRAAGFRAEAGRFVSVPGANGPMILGGLGDGEDVLALGGLAAGLAAGLYRYARLPDGMDAGRAALAWALGGYSFRRYKTGSPAREPARLVVEPETAAGAAIMAEGVMLARDLINTPASDMGPPELEAAARALAERFGAAVSSIEGGALIAHNYPMIHAVGRAAAKAPRLLDLVWGREDAPKVTLVGKGVCFDTGGLDLKPSSAMLTMKKDMGGAAVALGVAQMIMAAGLDVRLRVLIPAVENAVSGDAYRPGDVLTSRKGLTVEIGNTDAEGRLVLADALTEADQEQPALLVCLATLTGAARVATGFDLPPFFTNDEALAADLQRASAQTGDPIWRLPLFRPYGSAVEGDVADLTNAPKMANAGAITAALFLQRFVTQTPAFVHFDIAAWNDRARPGRPAGGEATAARALFAAIAARARA